MTKTEKKAYCRGCGKELKWRPHNGGAVYLPGTNEYAPQNFYGGYVCSKRCDIKACLQVSASMPGVNLNSFEEKSVRDNWAFMNARKRETL
jgi:hypothetical protein